MFFKREFSKDVKTINKDVTSEIIRERRYIFGILYYEDNSIYSCEMTEHKIKIGLK